KADQEFHKYLKRWSRAGRRHECRRGTQECVRYEGFLVCAKPLEPQATTTMTCHARSRCPGAGCECRIPACVRPIDRSAGYRDQWVSAYRARSRYWCIQGRREGAPECRAASDKPTRLGWSKKPVDSPW